MCVLYILLILAEVVVVVEVAVVVAAASRRLEVDVADSVERMPIKEFGIR